MLPMCLSSTSFKACRGCGGRSPLHTRGRSYLACLHTHYKVSCLSERTKCTQVVYCVRLTFKRTLSHDKVRRNLEFYFATELYEERAWTVQSNEAISVYKLHSFVFHNIIPLMFTSESIPQLKIYRHHCNFQNPFLD